MFDYWTFRYKSYNHSLKLWLENIKQTSIAIVALFPMALPALVFMPFVFIGIILKPDTSAASFFNTLWGYLLLLYSWVSYQRSGILALDYSHYLKSLPVSRVTKTIGDIGVTIYVANFFVLAPALLCLYALFNFNGDSSEATAVMVSMGSLVLLSSYYCLAAVRFNTPWISLFAFPLVMVTINPDMAKYHYTALWIAAFVCDHLPKPSINRLIPKLTGFTHLFVKWESHYSENNKLILVISLLLLSITKVIIDSVSAEVAAYFLNFAAFLFGAVLAANFFSMKKLQAEHQAFLSIYPVTARVQQFAAIKYTLFKLVLALLVLVSSGIFNGYQWALFVSFYIATLIGIIKWPARFILPPIAVGTLLVVLNVVFG